MEPKKAEFARLFDLFERLTNRVARKSQSHAASMPPPSDRKTPTEPVHRDLHDPNSAVPIKEAQQPDTKPMLSSTIWPRTTVVGVTGDTTSEVSMDNDFPIGKWYPFTFKMMFHRLYELEEWAKKVKDVLEKSQKDFKPLSEMNWKKEQAVRIDEDLSLNLTQPECLGRSASISKEPAPVPRTCNSSAWRYNMPGERLHDESVFTRATPTTSCQVCGGGSKKAKEGSRIVKKRCVGRDKIFSPIPSGQEENRWVYNAAAALTDRGGTTGEGTKKGSHLASFQLSKTDSVAGDERNLLAAANTTQVNAPCRWVFGETEKDAGSSRKRPYLFG